MSEIVDLATYRLNGPEAVQALLAAELAPGVSVHAAAWTFAMPENEFQASDLDASEMARLLHNAGLAFFNGNDDQPPALVLHDVTLFRHAFHNAGWREAAMTALGSGILIRSDITRCV
jgi:hypothetical protein